LLTDLSEGHGKKVRVLSEKAEMGYGARISALVFTTLLSRSWQHSAKFSHRLSAVELLTADQRAGLAQIEMAQRAENRADAE
jgi:hypothetical protein